MQFLQVASVFMSLIHFVLPFTSQSIQNSDEVRAFPVKVVQSLEARAKKRQQTDRPYIQGETDLRASGPAISRFSKRSLWSTRVDCVRDALNPKCRERNEGLERAFEVCAQMERTIPGAVWGVYSGNEFAQNSRYFARRFFLQRGNLERGKLTDYRLQNLLIAWQNLQNEEARMEEIKRDLSASSNDSNRRGQIQENIRKQKALIQQAKHVCTVRREELKAHGK